MRYFPARCFAVIASLVLAAPAFAAGDPHAAGKPKLLVKDGDKVREATDAEVHAASGHEKKPLDFTAIRRWDLGIYTLIVFGLLLFILSKYAWPNIKTGLEKRETNIRSALDEARKERDEAKVALAEAKKQLDEAALKVKAALDEARRDADTLRVTEREAGVKDAQAERERAKREIETAKDAALKEIYEKTVQLAALMSEKALRRNISADDHRRLLDESLAELKTASNKA